MADSPSGVIERRTIADPEVRGALFQEGCLDFTSIEGEIGGPVPMDELAPLANTIARNSRNAKFWYGDLLIYAKRHYVEEYSQLIDSLGHSPQEILDMERVATAFAPEDRMITTGEAPGLTWYHHRVSVPFFEKDKPRCTSLMAQALDEQWPALRLKIEINRVEGSDRGRERTPVHLGQGNFHLVGLPGADPHHVHHCDHHHG